jgi:plastocyanin
VIGVLWDMPRVISALAALSAVALLAAGCGGSDSSSGTGTSSGGGSAGGGGYGAGSSQAKTQTQSQTSSSSSSASSTASSSSGSSSSSRTAIALTAQDQNGLSFSKKALTAKAGKVTIAMVNPSGNSLPHAIAIEGNGVDQDGQTVQPGGGPSRVSLDLKPGTYTFYCPVDGHRAAGMQGTLTVR